MLGTLLLNLFTIVRLRIKIKIIIMSNPVRDARWKAFVGGRVEVEGKGAGVLLYYGATAKSKGMKKCGVALDSPENGKHNGTVNGKQYFDCTPGHGILTGVENCKMLEGGGGSGGSLRSTPKKVVKKVVVKKVVATSTPQAKVRETLLRKGKGRTRDGILFHYSS